MNAVVPGKDKPVVAELGDTENQMRGYRQRFVGKDLTLDIERIDRMGGTNLFVSQDRHCRGNLLPFEAYRTTFFAKPDD
jgi:hypothetical protein